MEVNDISYTILIEHRIEMRNSLPFSHMARPEQYAPRIVIEADLQRLHPLGIISVANPGECPYASAIVAVAREDGTLRSCLDYWQPNEIKIKYEYPLAQAMRFSHLCPTRTSFWRWIC